LRCVDGQEGCGWVGLGGAEAGEDFVVVLLGLGVGEVEVELGDGFGCALGEQESVGAEDVGVDVVGWGEGEGLGAGGEGCFGVLEGDVGAGALEGGLPGLGLGALEGVEDLEGIAGAVEAVEGSGEGGGEPWTVGVDVLDVEGVVEGWLEEPGAEAADGAEVIGLGDAGCDLEGFGDLAVAVLVAAGVVGGDGEGEVLPGFGGDDERGGGDGGGELAFGLGRLRGRCEGCEEKDGGEREVGDSRYLHGDPFCAEGAQR
jgi:hypothetical protein